MAADDSILVKGTTLTLETSASSASMSDGALRELDSDDRQPGDNPGYVEGIIEVDTETTGFSAAPTAGAVFNVYEQKINAGANDSPDPVDADYLGDHVFTLKVKDADEQQFLISDPFPIALDGAKYWLEWLDGGAGVASVDAGWEARLTPVTWRPSAS